MTTTLNIISYRYGHIAAQAIESALAQTKKFDVIRFFDDGAGDCAHLPALYPEVEFVLRPTNLGQVASIQDAVDHVTTDYCMNLGADNWLRPDCLETLLGLNADIISYDLWITGSGASHFAKNMPTDGIEQGHHRWFFRPGNVAVENWIHGSALFRVSECRKYRYRRAVGTGTAPEDWMMWQDMILGGATTVHLNEPLLYYRRHRTNFNG